MLHQLITMTITMDNPNQALTEIALTHLPI